MATTSNKKKYGRVIVRTMISHTIFVVLTVVAYNLFQWEIGGPWWIVRRILRLVEWPISWIVDWSIAADLVFFVPLEYTWNSALYSSMITEIALYSLLGGIFYGALAAGFVFLRAPRRPES